MDSSNPKIGDKVAVMMKALNWAKHCAQSQLISYAERRFSCESFSVVKRIGVNCGSELISLSLSVIRKTRIPSTSITKDYERILKVMHLFCTFLRVCFAILFIDKIKLRNIGINCCVCMCIFCHI